MTDTVLDRPASTPLDAERDATPVPTPVPMPVPTPGTPPRDLTGSTPKFEAVTGLADALSRTMRAMQRAKTHFVSQDRQPGGDWSTHVLLARIVTDGPQRVTALADVTQCDASTVSRQVSALVKEGLIQRQADPDDGRASLLAATDRGREAWAGFRGLRDRAFADMLTEWSVDDCVALTDLLGRFAGDIQNFTPHQLAQTSAASGDAASREEN